MEDAVLIAVTRLLAMEEGKYYDSICIQFAVIHSTGFNITFLNNNYRCYFINPEDVLEHGYCNGENCYLDGKPHPDFTDYLSM